MENEQVLSEEEVSALVDMMNSRGWQIFEKLNHESIQNYRFLATQSPGSVVEEMRTWYSGLASGREEALAEAREKVKKENQ